MDVKRAPGWGEVAAITVKDSVGFGGCSGPLSQFMVNGRAGIGHGWTGLTQECYATGMDESRPFSMPAATVSVNIKQFVFPCPL